MIKKLFGIILAIVIIIGLVCAGQMTGAYFSDTETASGNTATSWTASLWTQTTQADFNAGIGNNIDITSSPGDVRLPIASGWYNTGWRYRKKITIDHTKVGADLTNFPVLINIAADADVSARAQANGNDILFTSADAVTKLNHEIETFISSSGQLVAWVNVPALSSTVDTVLFMYYGNAAAANQQNIAATWGSSFKAVWHLDETSGTTVYDSTVNANNGTPNNVTLNTSGKIDGGDSFNGSTAYTDLGTGTSLNFAANSAFSFEGWFQTGDSYGPLVSFRNSTSGGADIDICLGYDGAVSGTAGSLMGLVRGDNGSAGYARITGPVVNNNAWHYFVLTRNSAGTIQLFCDGSSAGTASGTESGWSITTNLRALASERRWVQDNFTSTDNTYLTGTLDELRISASQLSNGWITTSYNNQNSPSTFATLSGEENISGTGANLILFWDGTGAVPNGWTDVSAAGQAFYNVFPRGAATYGGTGGADSHTHTITGFIENGTTTVSSGSSISVASGTHTHSLTNISISTASNLPNYRNLRIIRYNSGIPTVIPQGSIAIFDTASPSGWTRYSAEDSYFVRGAAATDVDGSGGSNTHSHAVTATVAGPDTRVNISTSYASVQVASSSHIHTINGSTNTVDNRPPYITMILAQANNNTIIPAGIIGMFDATPGLAWNVVSGTGGDLNSRFIVGSSSYGTTGGSTTHTHTMLSSGPSTPLTTVRSGTGVTAASNTHTHTITFDSESNIPPYRDVIFAKAIYSFTTSYSSPGTLASQVLNTGSSATAWNALFWDTTLPANTAITFEVRASDSSFSVNDTVLPWSPVSGGSPVLTGLPAGQYKQWRATLTTNDSSVTPVLSEVRLYYYNN